MCANFEKAQDEYMAEYLSTMAEMTSEAEANMEEKRAQAQELLTTILNLSIQVDDLTSTINAIVESKKRADLCFQKKIVKK